MLVPGILNLTSSKLATFIEFDGFTYDKVD